MTTLESYKSIWTLLEINPDVIIYFDSSTTMQAEQKQRQADRHKKNQVVDVSIEEMSARLQQEKADMTKSEDIEAQNANESSKLNTSIKHDEAIEGSQTKLIESS